MIQWIIFYTFSCVLVRVSQGYIPTHEISGLLYVQLLDIYCITLSLNELEQFVLQLVVLESSHFSILCQYFKLSDINYLANLVVLKSIF